MIKNINVFLKELANDPGLQKNTISYVFALNPNIDISKREKFAENVLPFLEKIKTDERKLFELQEQDQTETFEKFRNKDFRIKDVSLSSIRGFPKGEKPYRLDFLNENKEPESLVLLGTNGSGKSSIYDALEYSYCRRVGEAELRTFKECDDNDKWFQKYLSHFNNGFADCFCQINVNQKDFEPFSLQAENIPAIVRQKINPDTHFISDFDIYHKGRLEYENSSDKSFHYTIAKSLGLTELLDFEKNLKAFVFYKRQTENRRIAALKRENELSNRSVQSTQKELDDKNRLLHSIRMKQKSIPEEKKSKDSLELFLKVQQNLSSHNFDINKIKNLIKEYIHSYKEFVSIKVKGDFKEIQFLELGLDLLKESNDCPFCKNSKNFKKDISVNVKERIERLELLNKVTQKLNYIHNQLIEQLNTLLNQLNLFRSNINEEIKLLSNNSIFLDLLEVDNKILTHISSLIGNDFFVPIRNIEDNSNYIKNKFQFLNNLITSSRDYIDSDLSFFYNVTNQLNEDRFQIISNLESKISKNPQQHSWNTQSIELKKDIDELGKRILNINQRIVKNNEEILKLQKIIAEFDYIRNDSSEFLDFYHRKLNIEVEKAFSPIKLIVEEILEYYFSTIEERDISIEISKKPEIVDEETGDILSEIITAYIVPKDKKIQPLPVKKYLNTFHYRLFSTMVGISIAVASRLNTNINLPLVLDDIFYASDFKNRTTIQKFVKSLFKIFDDYTPDLPLQLILFTHDELVFESVINAASENVVKNISFARLFPHNDAKEKDDFLNIIYKIPTYLPQNIYEKVF